MNIQDLFRRVEQFIPFKYRKNFYKNIKNLTIEYIGIKDVNNIHQNKKSDRKVEYNYQTNTIVINLNIISNEAFVSENKEQTYNILLDQAMIYGLLQMASTTYKKNKPIKNGFDEINPTSDEINHTGLTEGYTELLANTISVSDNEKPHVSFAKQIELILGRETMYEAYFDELGIKSIQKKLQMIDEYISIKDLLELITYIYKNEDKETDDEINYIQEQLTNLFEKQSRKKDTSIERIVEFENQKIIRNKKTKKYMIQYI